MNDRTNDEPVEQVDVYMLVYLPRTGAIPAHSYVAMDVEAERTSFVGTKPVNRPSIVKPSSEHGGALVGAGPVEVLEGAAS